MCASHPRHRQADVGTRARVVVVAVVEVGSRMIAARPTPRRRCSAPRAARTRTRACRAELLGVVDRPLQHLHAAERAADGGQRALMPRWARSARCTLDQVRDGEAAGSAARTGVRSPGSSDDGPVVPGSPPRGRRDDEEAVGVERLARADQVVPPAGAGRVAVMARGMRVAGQRVADEDRVAARPRRACRRSRRRPRPAPGGAPESSTSGLVLGEEDEPARCA